MIGLAIQDEARTWLGTPYRHQHAILGFGVDCWRLIRAVGQACDVLPYSDEDFAPFAHYGDVPSPRMVLGVANTFLRPISREEAGLGDIALIEWRRGLPMHFLIRTEHHGRPYVLHASKKDRRVVEHGFTMEWPRRLHSWWRYPGV